MHGYLEIPYLFLVLNMISHRHALVRCAHSCDIMFNTRNKYGISAQPCIILYLFLFQAAVVIID